MELFEKLTKSQIDKYSDKIKNEYKKDAYTKTINSDTLKIIKGTDKSRNDAFERIYRTAMQVAKRRYAFGRFRENGYLSLSEVASIMTKEYVYYKSSVLSNFEDAEGKTLFKKFENAEKKTYEERTDNFFKKFGTEKVYTTDDKTLNDFLNDYKEGKISKEKLNSIIEDFKETNAEYLSTDYKTKNFESSDSIREDYFSDD